MSADHHQVDAMLPGVGDYLLGGGSFPYREFHILPATLWVYQINLSNGVHYLLQWIYHKPGDFVLWSESEA